MKKQAIFFIFLLSLCSVKLFAQGNYSPYSMLGIGDLEDNYYNRTAGLSNTGIAYRSSRNLINNNPASFSALDNQFFAVEMGLRGSLMYYYGQSVMPGQNQAADITFRRLALGMKLTKHWGSSFGLAPFSTQNYEFSTPYYIQGTLTELATSTYQIHGGTNKVYWSNSYEFFKHLSVGVEAGYIFGTVTDKQILQGSSGATLVSTSQSTSLSNLLMTYGLQYYGKVGKKWDFSLGATFANQSALLAQPNLTVLGADSVALTTPPQAEYYYNLPNTYGVGISVTKDQKYTFLADYKYQAWSDQHYKGTNYSLVNSMRGSVGFEISKKKTFYNTKIEKSYFQSGLYYGNSYLQVNGQQITDMGATVGFGINSLKSPLSYSVVLQYGTKGTTANNLIQQRYVNVVFAISYRDFWFTKGRKYD